MTSTRTYVTLAVFQAGDAVACAIPLPVLTKVLDDLRVPLEVRPVLPIVKAASVMGLLSVTRFPALARLTTALLTVYFVLAVGAHVRVRDRWFKAIPAASFLATYAVLTVQGPPVSRR